MNAKRIDLLTDWITGLQFKPEINRWAVDLFPFGHIEAGNFIALYNGIEKHVVTDILHRCAGALNTDLETVLTRTRKQEIVDCRTSSICVIKKRLPLISNAVIAEIMAYATPVAIIHAQKQQGVKEIAALINQIYEIHPFLRNN